MRKPAVLVVCRSYTATSPPHHAFVLCLPPCTRFHMRVSTPGYRAKKKAKEGVGGSMEAGHWTQREGEEGLVGTGRSSRIWQA
jgi:hypothetical protein